jgi:hypothetical protein
MKYKRRQPVRNGSALLTVLFIVMLVSIYTMGFLIRSDSELACGRNSLLRTQADYAARTGLEQASWVASYGVTSYSLTATEVGDCWFEGTLSGTSAVPSYTLDVTIRSYGWNNGGEKVYYTTYYGKLYCKKPAASSYPEVVGYSSIRRQ